MTAITMPTASSATPPLVAATPPDTTRTPPTTPSAMPTNMTTVAIPPITTLPVACWPHRCLTRLPERLTASIGPMSSSAMTGTTRKVTKPHAAAPIEPRMLPIAPPLSRMIEKATLTTAETIAQPMIVPRRRPAIARAAAMSGSWPCNAWSAAAARITL